MRPRRVPNIFSPTKSQNRATVGAFGSHYSSSPRWATLSSRVGTPQHSPRRFRNFTSTPSHHHRRRVNRNHHRPSNSHLFRPTRVRRLQIRRNSPLRLPLLRRTSLHRPNHQPLQLHLNRIRKRKMERLQLGVSKTLRRHATTKTLTIRGIPPRPPRNLRTKRTPPVQLTAQPPRRPRLPARIFTSVARHI